MEGIVDRLADLSGFDPDTILRIGKTSAILFLAFLFRALLLRFLNRKVETVKIRFIARNSVNYGTSAVVLFLLADIWFAGFGGLETYFGLLSAGVAIALRDPLTNLAAWLFILARKPFSVGDRIQTGQIRGDVIDIRVFQFLLLEVGDRVHAEQSTGRIVYIPNGRIFTEPTANYTVGFPFIWNEVAVLVTFESDWRLAKSIIRQVVEEYSAPIREKAGASMKNAAKTFLVAFNELGPVVYTSVEDSGVLLTARYLCEVRQGRASGQYVWERLLDAFAAEPSVELAYPTRRLYSAGEAGSVPGR